MAPRIHPGTRRYRSRMIVHAEEHAQVMDGGPTLPTAADGLSGRRLYAAGDHRDPVADEGQALQRVEGPSRFPYGRPRPGHGVGERGQLPNVVEHGHANEDP